MEKTISAIATPNGVGGIGIVRISGADALAVADAVFRPAGKTALSASPGGRAFFGHIVDEKERLVDEAVALVFRAPHSYTTEDVVELQCHGGQTVLRQVLALTYANGARPAERGEFTKRAFLGGRLDLAQAASVMDIVSAKTDAALDVATGHLSGRFSGGIHAMREVLLREIAHIEAAIDFPEDEVDEVLTFDIEKTVRALRDEIASMLKTAHAGRILRDGLLTAIIGKPNVGKSSLLNTLLREERAIVTDVPGTTRDAIEEYADVGGVPLRIVDTAGIREAEDEVERIGIARARAQAKKASLVLALFDRSRPFSEEDDEILSLLADEAEKVVCLLTKCDLPAAFTAEDFEKKAGRKPLLLSTKTGEGLEALTEAIRSRVYRDADEGEEGLFVSTEREADLLREADRHLEEGCRTIRAGIGLDFLSIDLRSAWETLGKLTGETVGEDIIDEIFSKFCIGK